MLRYRGVVHSLLRIMTIGLVSLATLQVDPVKSSAVPEASAEMGLRDEHLTIDFSGYTGGSVEKWLRTRHFIFEKDAKNRKLLGLSIADQTLELTANGRLSGFILNDSVNFNNVAKIKINWGVRQYPREVSYEKRVNNEALMLYIFFGKEKLSSGHILIPDSPYFIGLFLCQDEQVNFPYKGRYFHAGGRFVCLGKPNPGEMVMSEFDLQRGFENYFSKRPVPSVTGIGLGIDTSSAGDGGKGAAFIKSIEFFARSTTQQAMMHTSILALYRIGNVTDRIDPDVAR